jgi:hypothetical protein
VFVAILAVGCVCASIIDPGVSIVAASVFVALLTGLVALIACRCAASPQ